ncbi:MAG: LptF/LptG family permease [Crocinitomicaceae bacterium]|nr:LptF/LptG family permease [Crocinitomicaceae bacterium]
MLKKFDIYIIKKFLTTFFFMLGIIMLLAMVFDISEKLSELIGNKAPVKAIIFDYYLNFLVFYGNTFSSMIIFVSVIWFTAKMAQDSEIIPMMFSGRPFTRIMRPYMIAATFLMLISLILNHFIVPLSNQKRLDFEERFYRDRIYVENFHAEFPGNQYVYFDNYASDNDVVFGLKIENWSKDGKVVSYLSATSATNKPGTKKWTINDYYVRKIHSNGDKNEAIQDLIIAGDKKDTSFQFQIEELAIRDNRSETMSYSELKEFIAKEKAKGSGSVPMYEIELYRRTSYPFATYVLTLIGVAVSSKKTRGGIGANIAVGLGFVFIYIFAMKVTTVAAINVGLSTQLAVWIPNILFGIVGLYLYKIAPK